VVNRESQHISCLAHCKFSLELHASCVLQDECVTALLHTRARLDYRARQTVSREHIPGADSYWADLLLTLLQSTSNLIGTPITPHEHTLTQQRPLSLG
jgi:hypothetical protein